MCSPNSVHVEAERELDEIGAMGTPTQYVLAVAAFEDARVASVSGTPSGARHVTAFSKVNVATNAPYTARVYYWSVTFPGLEARAVAGVYEDGAQTCMDVLACDVTGNSWFHGPMDPIVRAAARIPG